VAFSLIEAATAGLFSAGLMGDAGLMLGDVVPLPSPETTSPAEASARVRAMVEAHLAFVWRTARRLGVPEPELDDVTQKVFWQASRQLAEIPAEGERGALFRITMGLAANARRSHQRRREVDLGALPPDAHADRSLGPDEVIERRSAQAIALAILDGMPDDLRAVFILFEIEELSTPEIATMMDLPVGTVASRLRRAREHAAEQLKRIEARRSFPGDADDRSTSFLRRRRRRDRPPPLPLAAR
jgi:RNA polymerase sigma-70 factor (ECF subfamily)